MDTNNFSRNADTNSMLGKPLAMGDKNLIPIMSDALDCGDKEMKAKTNRTTNKNGTYKYTNENDGG